MQKSKSTRRRKEQEAKAEVLPRLTDDEKGDLVNQAVEALQDAIQEVSTHLCLEVPPGGVISVPYPSGGLGLWLVPLAHGRWCAVKPTAAKHGSSESAVPEPFRSGSDRQHQLHVLHAVGLPSCQTWQPSKASVRLPTDSARSWYSHTR